MNKPLTIEQLKSFEVGDWVWVLNIASGQGIYLKIEEKTNPTTMQNVVYLKGFYGKSSDYGKTWLAYKNKEQAEGKDTEMIERIEKAYEHNVAECERCIKKVDIKHQFAMENMKEHIRKDTAKEIYKKINNIDVNALDWEEAVFAVFEQYGVEVEE